MDLQKLTAFVFTLLLLGTVVVLPASAGQGEPSARPRDFYDAFADEVFRCQNEVCDVKGKEFVIVLRYTRTMRVPDAQITISKSTDGRVNAVFSRLPKPLSAYFPDNNNGNNLTIEQVKSLAKDVPVDHRAVRLPDKEWETILTDYKDLRFSPMLDTALYFDGTQYELWFIAPVQRAHYILHGASIEASDKDPQPVEWMKQLYKSLKDR